MVTVEQVPRHPASSTQSLRLSDRWLRLKAVHPFLMLLLWLPCPDASPAANGPEERPKFQRAQTVAKNICSVCHLFPEPELLDRYTCVKLPQVDIGADRARLEAGEQMLGLRLKNHAIANQVERLVLRRTLPAVLG